MIKLLFKQVLNENHYIKIRDVGIKIIYLLEVIYGGTKLRESFLVKLLEQHYSSKFRRQWKWSKEVPHFEDQKLFFFNFIFSKGEKSIGIHPFFRGFFSAEIIRDNNSLLDIGCGDGFFTKRFFSDKCSHIDAIDIDYLAIQNAKKNNYSNNIRYHILDAVKEQFPKNVYDVIVWDGAIGHFSSDTTKLMLTKICNALNPDGLFVGSESLGNEGSDHLQRFYS